ncbi:Carbon-nitrogen hydrolase [Popillia japonica]|uniref:Nitrilase and fragile histidine triad fusion protein NitFhit n=1 Tax=Popillia japonica TaxID=7064 RepID=A0AAW1K4S6_POPJA
MTSCNDKVKNFACVKRLVAQAVEKNAKVIFLPEGVDYIGTNKDQIKELAETLDGPLIKEYSYLAKENKVWLSIGGFHEFVKDNEEKKLNNCHIIIDDHGRIVSIYRKLHLFDVYIPERNIDLKESDNVSGGNEIIEPVKTPAGMIGMAICYDLRFPELSTLLRKKGATIITFPSAFTNTTGQVHWEVLLRARAIENQCYVVAAAQYGKHNKNRISYGQSLVIDPWGKIIAEGQKYTDSKPNDESVIIAEVDNNFISQVRNDMPVLEHRRNDIYKLIEMKNEQIFPDYRFNYQFADKVIQSSTVFYCTKYSFAFTNIRCVVPGHVLVSSLRCAKRLENLSADEVADLFQTVVKVQKVMELVHNSSSSTICVQDGKYAGQTVAHVHCHILPRKQGDFANNDDVYMQLANHDKEGSSQIRTIEEMSKEARTLRNYFYPS